MNYKKIYDRLIEDAKINPKSELYKESHHIIPKCMNGSNDKDNIILLTARQHYLAHWLLYKIYKTSSLVHAWNLMSVVGIGQEKRKVNSHLFGYCKKERSLILSKQFTGEGNNFYGKTHSEETKDFISQLNKGQDRRSEESILSWIENVAKKPKSKEHREKISRKGLVMLQNINTLEIIRVPNTDDRVLLKEWVNPRILTPELKSKCLYCDMITTNSNLKRWHNDKCKNRKRDEN